MKLFWLISFITFFLTACAAKPVFRADVSLIEPYSPALEKKEPFPFQASLSLFKKGDRQLVYIAANHENSIESPTFRLIKKVFAVYPIEVALIEGVEAASPQMRFLDQLRESPPTDFYKGGEPAYTALLADQRYIPFEGMEPSEEILLKAVLKSGFSYEDLMGFYVVRQIPQWRRQGKFDNQPFEDVFQLFVQNYYARWGPVAPWTFTLADFKAWYQKGNGKPFSLEKMDPEEAAPLPGSKLLTHKLSRIVGRIRNQYIVTRIANQLSEKRTVLVVIGYSHLPTQRKAIEEMMGKAVLVTKAS